MSYIEFEKVNKEYKMGEITIKALENTNFEIEKGELVVIVRPIRSRKNNNSEYTRWNGYSNIRKCDSRWKRSNKIEKQRINPI